MAPAQLHELKTQRDIGLLPSLPDLPDRAVVMYYGVRIRYGAVCSHVFEMGLCT